MAITVGDILESNERLSSPRDMMSRRAHEISDEQLMVHLGGPRVEATISTLCDRYNRTVFGVGLKILGDRSLAEELSGQRA